jgi:hypothetical protein
MLVIQDLLFVGMEKQLPSPPIINRKILKNPYGSQKQAIM